jgi:hypothetical protein
MSDGNRYLSIIRRYPRLGWDQNVSITPDITLRFNLPINVDLVDTDPELNQYVVFVDLGTDQTQPVSFKEWNAAERTLIINPTTQLSPGALYQITVRKGLQTAQGRSMLQDETWTFQTSAAALGKVTLFAPGDSTAWGLLPTLTWYGVWFASGSVSYDVEVDSNFLFGDNPLWETTITTTTTGGVQSASIGTTLAAESTYFWRVRARTTAVTGDWSDARAFWVGTIAQASPDTVSLFSPAAVFRLDRFTPDDRATNLPTWPTIRIEFTQPLSGASVNDGTIQIFEKTVDGRADILPRQLVGNTYTLEDNTLTIVPAGDILKNHRYEFTLTTGLRSASGAFLLEPIEFTLIGRYLPIYGGVEVVKNRMGNLISDIDEDEILFHLWRSSLHVNEMLITRVHRIRARATRSDLENYQPPGGTTEGMMQFTELSAAIELLEHRYFDLANVAGQGGALATFEFSLNPDILVQIQDRIRDLRGQRNVAAAAWLQEVVVPRTTGKSIRWINDKIYPFAQDWSYKRRHRF